MVWKFCASASDADSAAKIAMIVFLGFMREFYLIALHRATTKSYERDRNEVSGNAHYRRLVLQHGSGSPGASDLRFAV